MADKAFREAVGALNDHGSLEKAINDLTSAGWDHADLSLLGSDKTLLPHAAPASANCSRCKKPRGWAFVCARGLMRQSLKSSRGGGGLIGESRRNCFGPITAP